MLTDILITAVINAGVYAMLAMGFSLIFGVARIINMAHTAFYMLAGYVVFSLTSSLGLPLLPSMLLAIAAVVVVAVVAYRLLIDPMREHEASVLIITVTLAMVFQELMLLLYGGHFRSVPALVSGFVTVLGVRVNSQYVVTIVAMVTILAAVWIVLMRTRLGLAIRATAQDREIANVMGMNVSMIMTVTMAIASAMAATAGVLVAPLFILEPRIWLQPLTVVLAIVVLGGIGSLKGSIIASAIIALCETLVTFLLPSGAFLKGAFSLGVMIIVLLIRPEGLFGVSFEGER
ncbi:MAG: branched-chain amino acid ABC transporter permease [Bacillota bacterium]